MATVDGKPKDPDEREVRGCDPGEPVEHRTRSPEVMIAAPTSGARAWATKFGAARRPMMGA